MISSVANIDRNNITETTNSSKTSLPDATKQQDGQSRISEFNVEQNFLDVLIEKYSQDQTDVPAKTYDASGKTKETPTSKTKNKTEEQSNTVANKELSDEEKKYIKELKEKDSNVKAHEQAHKNVGGSLVKGIVRYGYENGPDGKKYAVSGEVSIDISVEEDSKATINKMQKVRAAALAPSDPSAQDLRVASMASAIEATARAEAYQSSSTNTQATNSQQLPVRMKAAMQAYKQAENTTNKDVQSSNTEFSTDNDATDSNDVLQLILPDNSQVTLDDADSYSHKKDIKI